MKYMYSLWDDAVQKYGVITLHDSEADAKRSLCQQISNNKDLEIMLSMDFFLVCLGTFDERDSEHPTSIFDEPESISVRVIYSEYLKCVDNVRKELRPDDNA